MSLWTFLFAILAAFGLIDEDAIPPLDAISAEEQSSAPILSLIKVGGANNGNH